MPCRRFIAALVPFLLPFLLAACGEPEDTGPGRPVAHRRAAFQAILDAFEPMGIRLRNKQYEPDDFINMAKRLDQAKEGPWQYFTADSNYPPTHATGKVWSEPDKFEAGRKAFLQATAQLVQATETRNGDKVQTAYEALHDTCRDCHKAFKK